MLRYLAAHKKLTAFSAFVVLILGCWGWGVSASLRGQIVARYDILRGHYLELTFGLPVPEPSTYARVLNERYGIEMRAVAGCIVSESLIADVRGYNKVSVEAANRRWGRDVFKDSWREAVHIWSQTHPDGRNVR